MATSVAKLNADVRFSTDNRKAIALRIRSKTYDELECGPVPNVMAALPNIAGALCSTTQSLADAHY